MARLNEPQAAIESIDALKRRFVRQNREIARANSTQSLRIRNLESEISRLLSENIGLREHIIKLQHELEKDRGRDILENVGAVKDRFEAKLAELGDLVKELGAVQKGLYSNQSPQRRRIGRGSPKKSPDQKNWKNVLTLSEVTGGMDGRLPPIVEDKYFPRRTLDAEELLGIISDPDNAPDSPDLGPPPVAHFEDGDPVKTDASQGHIRRKSVPEMVDETPSALSANLETRKKRRESSQHTEPGRPPITEFQNTVSRGADAETRQPLKSGAKRKLSVREDDERVKIQDTIRKDEFKFNRKQESSDTNEGKLEKIGSSETRSANAQKPPIDPTSSRGVGHEKVKEAPLIAPTNLRKALGPKSVNTDPITSPVKNSNSGLSDKITELKKDVAKKAREREHNRARDKPPIGKVNRTIDKAEPVVCPVEQAAQPSQTHPETPAPAALDLFSPIPSEPSAPRPKSQDTPPPSDIDPEASKADAFGSLGRSTRRPRGGVSYAEPNLRAKMRRPTKELVDAVGAEEKMHQSVVFVKSEESLPGLDKSTLRTVVIKKEDGLDSTACWKDFPLRANETQQQRLRDEAVSPLGNKVAAAAMTLPVSVITDRRRRGSALHRVDDVGPVEKHTTGSGSGPSDIIKALAAGRNRPLKREEEKNGEEDVGKTDAFEFTGSSPSDVAGGGSDGKEAREAVADNGRASRRHSSVPTGLRARAGEVRGKSEVRSEDANRGIEKKKTDVIESGEKVGKSLDEGAKSGRAVLSIRGAGIAERGLETGRAERAASRRRSMML